MPACLACGYIRQRTDSSPDDECPKCGRIYSKVQSVLDKESARKKPWFTSSKKDSDLDPIGSLRKANRTGVRISQEVPAWYVGVTLLTVFGMLYLWSGYESSQAQQRALQAQQQADKAKQEEARRQQRAAREAEQQRQRDLATRNAATPRSREQATSSTKNQPPTSSAPKQSFSELEREVQALLSRGERLNRNNLATCGTQMRSMQPRATELRAQINQLPFTSERVWLGAAASHLWLCVSCNPKLGPEHCILARGALRELR